MTISKINNEERKQAMSNRNNNRRYNNNYNKQKNKNNGEHRYDVTKRTIDSLLSFNDFIEYDEDVKARQQNQNNNNNNRNDQNSNNENKNNDRFEGRDVSNNILRQTIEEHDYYRKDEMIYKLTKQNGLIDMIEDIKNCKKKNLKTPSYVEKLFKDIEFLRALVEVLDEYCDKEDPFGRVLVSKKDMNIIFDNMYISIKNIEKYKKGKFGISDKTGEEMTRLYNYTITKHNKKKIKKLMKECPKVPITIARIIASLCAGGNIDLTLYTLLRYMYKDATEFKFTEKIIRTVFKIFYPKEDHKKLIEALMLEKRPNGDPIYRTTLSEEMDIVWSKVDKIMREELEKLSMDEIEEIIRDYIKKRKQQERKYRLPRRFGNRKAYHPDDFRKIVTVCEKIEEQDRSLLPYLR